MGSVIPLKKEIDNSYLRLKNLVGGKLEEVSQRIKLDRKILAEIAYDNPEAFKTIVKKAQSALN